METNKQARRFDQRRVVKMEEICPLLLFDLEWLTWFIQQGMKGKKDERYCRTTVRLRRSE